GDHGGEALAEALGLTRRKPYEVTDAERHEVLVGVQGRDRSVIAPGLVHPDLGADLGRKVCGYFELRIRFRHRRTLSLRPCGLQRRSDGEQQARGEGAQAKPCGARIPRWLRTR